MAASEEELTLVFKARNLATKEVDGLRKNIETSARSIESHFNTMGDKLVARFHKRDVREIGNAISDSILALATGGSVADVIGQAGLALAGGLASSFAARLLEKLASSTLVTTLLGTLTGLGTTLGGIVSAAIPVGMAALPVLLLAAVAAAIVFLIANPEIAGKIAQVAGDIIRTLVGGLASLAGALLGVFARAFQAIIGAIVSFVSGVAQLILGIPAAIVGIGAALIGVFSNAFGHVTRIVGAVVGAVVSVIGGIVKAIRDALAWLGTLAQAGRDFNKNNPVANYGPFGAGAHTGHAAGGWVGLHGPELGWLGERGPEYVRKAGTGTGDEGRSGGPQIIQLVVDGSVLAQIVNRHQDRELRRLPARG